MGTERASGRLCRKVTTGRSKILWRETIAAAITVSEENRLPHLVLCFGDTADPIWTGVPSQEAIALCYHTDTADRSC